MIALIALLLVAPMFVPFTAMAQEAEGTGANDRAHVWVPPATDAAQQIADLFGVVTWLALLVFVVVQVALFYTIWRFRKNRDVPEGETHRGHTKAEIMWTIIPALILVFVGVLSVQVMSAIEAPPQDLEGEAIPIRVEAAQFAFRFTYPEEYGDPSTGTLWVETGQTVALTVTSLDVQHALWIPEFGIKIDAYPGRENEQWFTAPAPGEYFIQCAEYCGFGHHAMHARIVVYEEGAHEGRPVGAPEREEVEVPPGPETEITFREEPGETSGPWSIDPVELTVQVAEGEGIHIRTQNAESNSGIHNFTIAGRLYDADAYGPGESRWLNFTADMLDGPGTYEYWCAVPGHRSAGMQGTIVIEAVEGEAASGGENTNATSEQDGA